VNIRKRLTSVLKALASGPKGDWSADHPPIPDYQIFNSKYQGEFLTVESPNGRDGSWSYQIVTDGPDSPDQVGGFRTVEDAMKEAEKAIDEMLVASGDLELLRTELESSYSQDELNSLKSLEDLIDEEKVRHGYDDREVEGDREYYAILYEDIKSGILKGKG